MPSNSEHVNSHEKSHPYTDMRRLTALRDCWEASSVCLMNAWRSCCSSCEHAWRSDLSRNCSDRLNLFVVLNTCSIASNSLLSSSLNSLLSTVIISPSKPNEISLWNIWPSRWLPVRNRNRYRSAAVASTVFQTLENSCAFDGILSTFIYNISITTYNVFQKMLPFYFLNDCETNFHKIWYLTSSGCALQMFLILSNLP